MKSSYRPTDPVGRSPPLKRLPSPFGRRAGDEGLRKFVSIERLSTPSNLSAAERFEGESFTGYQWLNPHPALSQRERETPILERPDISGGR